MDQNYFNTDEAVRKSGSHLTLAERGMIQALHKKGMSLRGIAKSVGCAHTTIYYELKRGTPPRKSNRGRAPGDILPNVDRKPTRQTANAPSAPAKLTAMIANHSSSGCASASKDRWSIDGCVGAARLMKSFPGRTIPCTKTLYNMLWANKLPLSLFDLPHALGRKQHRKWNRKNKRMLGRSIEERPAIAAAGTEIGHWEVDTVVGRRQGREAVIFTAVEKVLREFIAIRIPRRTSAGVEVAMTKLREEFGDEKFSKVFKTMTADNGPEFETFSQRAAWHEDSFHAPVQLMGTSSERAAQWPPAGLHPQRDIDRMLQ